MDMGMIYPGRRPASTPAEYRNTLRAIVQDAGSPHIHYLDGTALCSNLTGLTSDLLHPSDRGMTEIANKLSQAIKPILRIGETS